MFLWNYGAGRVNCQPLTRNVFIRASDIDADRVMSSPGPVPPPTLSYYVAHDYIAFGGTVDTDRLTAQLGAGARELDPQRSGLYARYRVLVAHMLDRKAGPSTACWPRISLKARPSADCWRLAEG